jgi:signal peptidase I
MNTTVDKLKKIGFQPVSQKSHSVIMKSQNGVAAVYTDGNYEGFIKQTNLDEGFLDESKFRHFLELALIVGLTTTYFTTDITIVSGISMEPTYHSGEVIIKSKVPKDVSKLLVSKNSVVKFKTPDGYTALKRIVGMPGDTIEYIGARVLINGEFVGENPDWFRKYQADIFKDKSSPHKDKLFKPHVIHLESNQYYVMGDNKVNSVDSRNYGPISSDSILSVVKK